MLEPSLEEMLDKEKNPEISSKFELITMITKRARQINNGAEIVVKTNARKPVSIAMWEIYHGKIKPIKKETKRRE